MRYLNTSKIDINIDFNKSTSYLIWLQLAQILSAPIILIEQYNIEGPTNIKLSTVESWISDILSLSGQTSKKAPSIR